MTDVEIVKFMDAVKGKKLKLCGSYSSKNTRYFIPTGEYSLHHLTMVGHDYKINGDLIRKVLDKQIGNGFQPDGDQLYWELTQEDSIVEDKIRELTDQEMLDFAKEVEDKKIKLCGPDVVGIEHYFIPTGAVNIVGKSMRGSTYKMNGGIIDHFAQRPFLNGFQNDIDNFHWEFLLEDSPTAELDKALEYDSDKLLENIDNSFELRSRVGMVIGQASMCWTDDGEFNVEQATKLADDLVEYIIERKNNG